MIHSINISERTNPCNAKHLIKASSVQSNKGGLPNTRTRALLCLDHGNLNNLIEVLLKGLSSITNLLSAINLVNFEFNDED